MRVVLRNEAKRDLRLGAFFYEGLSKGLGERFLDFVEGQLADLEHQAGIHSKVLGFHCKSLQRFPYAIYYLVQAEAVDVVAILDQRRHPAGIARRLREGGTE